MYDIKDEDVEIIDLSQNSSGGQSTSLEMQLPIIELMKVLLLPFNLCTSFPCFLCLGYFMQGSFWAVGFCFSDSYMYGEVFWSSCFMLICIHHNSIDNFKV